MKSHTAKRQKLQNALPILLALVFIILASGQVYAQATTAQQPRTLTAIGNAEVRVRPDVAVVRLGVQVEAQTAAQAREQNAAIVTRMITALQALGIRQNQIETSTFQIYPVRRFPNREQTGEPPIVGYRVVNIVSVRTENLDLVPRIIDASVQAGANTVESVDFQLKDDAAARQDALSQASAEAVRNAQTMARALGVRLVRIHQVQQGGVGIVPPPYPVRSLAFEAATPTPIFGGEVTVNASITLTYVID